MAVLFQCFLIIKNLSFEKTLNILFYFLIWIHIFLLSSQT